MDQKITISLDLEAFCSLLSIVRSHRSRLEQEAIQLNVSPRAYSLAQALQIEDSLKASEKTFASVGHKP